MKRILLLGMILAICVLAFPQGVMAGDITPDGVVVDAAYEGSELVFTAEKYDPAEGGPTWPWALSENPTADTAPWNLQEDALYFTVDSTLDWDLSASGSDDGYMRTTTTTVKPLLDNAFLIKDEGDDAWVTTPTAGTEIETGVPADTAFWKDIDQKVVQADYSADDYSITLTFTCSNAW